MDEQLAYLNKTLGINTEYLNEDFSFLPSFLTSRFRLQAAQLGQTAVMLMKPLTPIDNFARLKTQARRLTELCGREVVLVFDSLPFRSREYLLRARIPFLVGKKQIYLPFLGTYLQEKGDAEMPIGDKLLPSAQLVLLHFLYGGAKPLKAVSAGRNLNLTPASISRAFAQLGKLQLGTIRQDGPNHVLFYDWQPSALFQKAKYYLANPVKRTIYVPKEFLKEDMPLSGLSALSEMTMLGEPACQCYATDRIADLLPFSSSTLLDPDSWTAVEKWRYDPKVLGEGKTVDPLSLALSFKDSQDERVQMAIEHLLIDLWRQLDGKRD